MKKEKSKERDEDKDKENDKYTVVLAYDDVLIMYHENFVNLALDDSSLIMDSDASCHVTPRRDLFTSYTVDDFGTIKLGDEGLCKIVGMEDVWLEISMGTSCN